MGGRPAVAGHPRGGARDFLDDRSGVRECDSGVELAGAAVALCRGRDDRLLCWAVAAGSRLRGNAPISSRVRLVSLSTGSLRLETRRRVVVDEADGLHE